MNNFWENPIVKTSPRRKRQRSANVLSWASLVSQTEEEERLVADNKPNWQTPDLTLWSDKDINAYSDSYFERVGMNALRSEQLGTQRQAVSQDWYTDNMINPDFATPTHRQRQIASHKKWRKERKIFNKATAPLCDYFRVESSVITDNDILEVEPTMAPLTVNVQHVLNTAKNVNFDVDAEPTQRVQNMQVFLTSVQAAYLLAQVNKVIAKLERLDGKITTLLGMGESTIDNMGFEVQSGEVTVMDEISDAVVEESTIVDQASIETWNMNNLLNRKLRIATGTYGEIPTGSVILSANLPEALVNGKTSTVIKSILKMFSMFTGKVRLTMSVNGNMMAGGSLVMSYDPYNRATSANSTLSRTELIACSHVSLDVATQEAVTLDLDLHTPSAYVSNVHGRYASTTFGRVIVSTLSQAMLVTGAAPMSVSLYLEFLSADLAGLVNPDDNIAEYFDVQSSVRMVSAVGTGFVDDITDHFPLTAFGDYHLTNVKRTQALEYAQREGFLGVTTWGGETPIGRKLAQIDVHPCTHTRETIDGVRRIRTTPLGAITSMYKYWGGSIEYDFWAPVTESHAGVIAIVYIPGSVNVPSSNYHDYPHVVWNIKNQKRITVRVNYEAPTTWKHVTTSSAFMDVAKTSMGTLALYVVSPLMSNLFPGVDITILSFVKAGSDYRLARLGNVYKNDLEGFEIEADAMLNPTRSFTSLRMQPDNRTLEEMGQRFSKLGATVNQWEDPGCGIVIPVKAGDVTGRDPLTMLSSLMAFGSGSMRYRFDVSRCTFGSTQFKVEYISNLPVTQANLQRPWYVINRSEMLYMSDNTMVFDQRVNPVFETTVPYESIYNILYNPRKINVSEKKAFPELSLHAGALIIYPIHHATKYVMTIYRALGSDYTYSTPTAFPPFDFPIHTTTVEDADEEEKKEVAQTLEPEGFDELRSSGFRVEAGEPTWYNGWGIAKMMEQSREIIDAAHTFTVPNLQRAVGDSLGQSIAEFAKATVSTSLVRLRTHGTLIIGIQMTFLLTSYAFVTMFAQGATRGILSMVILASVSAIVGFQATEFRNAMEEFSSQFTVQNGFEFDLASMMAAAIGMLATLMGIMNAKTYLTAVDGIAIQARNMGWFKQGWESITKMKEAIASELMPTVPESVKNIFSRFQSGDKTVWTEALDLLDPAKRLDVLKTNALRTQVLRVYVQLKSLHDETMNVAIDNDAKRVLRQIFTKFETLRAEVLDFHTHDEFRVDPFHISFCGRPKIGKSTMMTNIMRDVFEIMNWPRDNMSYVVSPGMKHYDNYLGQWCIVFDDLGAISSTNPEESDLGRMMAMKSNQRLKLPMAKLDDKGREFTSQLILSATNVLVYNRNGFADNGAINRRRDFLVEADRINDGEQCGTQRGPYTGVYAASAVKYRVCNSLNGEAETEWLTYVQLLRVLRPRIEAHFQYQEVLKTNATTQGPTAEYTEAFQVQNSGYEGYSSVQHDYFLSMPFSRFKGLPHAEVRKHMTDEEDQELMSYTRGEILGRDLKHAMVNRYVRSLKQCAVKKTAYESLKLKLLGVTSCDVIKTHPWAPYVVAGILLTLLYFIFRYWNLPKTDKMDIETEMDDYKSKARPTAVTESMVTSIKDARGYVKSLVAESSVDSVKDRVHKTERTVLAESGVDSVKERVHRPVVITAESGVDTVKDAVHRQKTIVAEGNYANVPLLSNLDEVYWNEEEAMAKIDRYAAEGSVVDTLFNRYYGNFTVQAVEDKQAATIMASLLDNYASLHRVTRLGKEIKLHGLMLVDQFVTLPRHFFEQDKIQDGDKFTITTRSKKYEQSFSTKRYVGLGNTDAVVYLLSERVTGAKGIVHHICTSADHGKFHPVPGSLISLDFTDKGIAMINKTFLSKIKQSTEVKYRVDDYINYLNGYQYSASTERGDCGSILYQYSKNSSAKILGFHVGSVVDKSQGHSERLVKETVIDAMSRLAQINGYFQVQSTLDLAEKMFQQGLIEDGKPYWGIKELDHRVQLIGTLPAAYTRRTPSRSQLIPTILDAFLPTPPTHEGAVLSDFDPRCPKGKSIIMKQISGYGQDVAAFPQRHYDIIEDHITAKYQRLTGDIVHESGKLRVLTLDEAINGIPGIDHADRMNMSTSEGAYWMSGRGPGEHNKSWLFDNVGIGEEKHYQASPQLRARVAFIIDEAAEGRLVPMATMETLKDERRPLKHTRNLDNDPDFCPKTRSFTICPVDYTIVVRMFCLAFVQMMEKNREDIEPQIGIDPCSGDWTEMYKQLKAVSPYAVAGDFGNYDRGNPAENLACSGRIINRCYGDNERIQRIRHTLMTMAYNHLAIVQGVVVLIDKGLPSGYPLTSMVNSINNDIYKYQAWLAIMPAEFKPLEVCDVQTRSKYYGDDHLHAIKVAILKYFNMQTIGKFFEDSGIKYTDENKNHWKDAPEYVPLEKATFMKRGFVTDTRTGYMRAPLDKTTIESRYRMYMDTAFVEHDEMVTELVSNSLRDAFMHGREYFNEVTSTVLTALKEADKGHLMPAMSYGSEELRWDMTCNGDLGRYSYTSGQSFGL